MARTRGTKIQPDFNIPALKESPLPWSYTRLLSTEDLGPILEALGIASCAKGTGTVGWIHTQQITIAHSHTRGPGDLRAPLMTD